MNDLKLFNFNTPCGKGLLKSNKNSKVYDIIGHINKCDLCKKEIKDHIINCDKCKQIMNTTTFNDYDKYIQYYLENYNKKK